MTEELNEKNINEKKKKSELREIVEVVGIALVLAFLIKTFVVGNYWIPSESMLPTIEVNDKVVVTNFSYWLDGPERGDVVVFHYPLDPKKDYIKRCIGEPGEVIEFKDSKLYVNGTLVEEPYLPVGLEFDDFGPVMVPEGSYFMCGDNRNHSSDSRSWGFVEKKHIIGKAQFIYWPFDRWVTL
jgi:signal peptidase I